MSPEKSFNLAKFEPDPPWNIKPKSETYILFKGEETGIIRKSTRRRPSDSVDDWDQIGFDPDAAGEPPSGSIWLGEPREGKEFPIKNKII